MDPAPSIAERGEKADSVLVALRLCEVRFSPLGTTTLKLPWAGNHTLISVVGISQKKAAPSSGTMSVTGSSRKSIPSNLGRLHLSANSSLPCSNDRFQVANEKEGRLLH